MIKKHLRWIIIAPLLVYLLVCVYMYLQQGTLLYHPDRHTLQQAEDAVDKIGNGATVDKKYHAIVVEPKIRPSQGTVIFYHGNAGNALKFLPYHQSFNALGYRMVLAEYPGFGWRSGQPNESQMVAEGIALYTHWRQATPKNQPVILVGKSLGTGVAIRVAAQSAIPPSKVVLLTPFTSVLAVASDKYPVLPVRWLLRDTFLSDQYLSKYAGQISFLIAGKDEVVGTATGFHLLEKAKMRGPTDSIVISDADHNNWMPNLQLIQWGKLLQRDAEK